MKMRGKFIVGVEEEFSDVLFDIESTIVEIYSNNLNLVDRQVLLAIDTLYRFYERNKKNKDGFFPVPTGLAGNIYNQVLHVCESWLGRASYNDADDCNHEVQKRCKLTITEVMRCLKRLRKSMKIWHKQGGNQAYLNYVNEFVSQAHS